MEDQPDGSRKRNPPQRCPRPRDSTPEDLTISHKREEQMIMKVEEEEVETYVGGDQPSTEEVGLIMKCEEDEIPIDATDGCDVRNTSERHLILSADCKSEDEATTHDSPGVNPHSRYRPYNSDSSMDPSDLGESSGITKLYLGSPTVSDPPNPEEPYLSHAGDLGGENLFTNAVFGKSLIENDNFAQYLGIKTGEGSSSDQAFSCLECGRCFRHKGDLVRHQRIHTGERPYSCALCGKSFSQHATLAQHERTHTGERPYACTQCGKRFTCRTSLVDHHRIHTGERPFACSVCGKTFNKRGTLVMHEKIHTGDRPFSCSECGKAFIVRRDLVKHQVTHTDGRPHVRPVCTALKTFSCSECGKSFLRKGDFVKHQRVHTGERPFSCLECGKTFTQKGHLAKHRRTHTS